MHAAAGDAERVAGRVDEKRSLASPGEVALRGQLSRPVASRREAVGRGRDDEPTGGGTGPSLPRERAFPEHLPAQVVAAQDLGAAGERHPGDLGGESSGASISSGASVGSNGEAAGVFAGRVEDRGSSPPWVVTATKPYGPIARSSIGRRSSCFQTHRPDAVSRPIRSRSCTRARPNSSGRMARCVSSTQAHIEPPMGVHAAGRRGGSDGRWRRRASPGPCAATGRPRIRSGAWPQLLARRVEQLEPVRAA